MTPVPLDSGGGLRHHQAGPVDGSGDLAMRDRGLGRIGVLAVLGVIGIGCASAPSKVVPALPAEVDRGAASPATLTAARACDDKHDAHACATAADAYSRGEDGRAYAPDQAVRYATLGCDGGDALACAVLASHYQNGLGVAWSGVRALALYDRACRAGAGLGCAGLAQMYGDGHGVEVDRAKARSYRERAHTLWLAACHGGDRRWCSAAATDDHDDTTPALVTQACDSGYAPACVRALRLQLTSSSRGAAMTALGGLCDHGDADACYTLGRAHRLARDPQAATARTVRACVLGDPDACVDAGVRHEVERDVPENDPVARDYFARACTRGASRGCLNLAQDLLMIGGAASEIAQVAQRGCELGSGDSCALLIKVFVQAGDTSGAGAAATAGCRLGARDACHYVIAHDATLPRTHSDPLTLYREACDAKVASACTRLGPLVVDHDRAARELAAAIAAHDAGALARLVAPALDLYIDSDDPACRRWADKAETATAADHAEVLRCLATLAPQVEPAADPRTPAALAYLTTGRLELDVHAGVIDAIRPVWAAPTPARRVPRAARDARRIEGKTQITPTYAVQKAMRLAGRAELRGAFKVCIADDGVVQSVTPLLLTGSLSYDRVLERNVSTWLYRPFEVDGKPTPVCTAVTLIYGLR